MKPISLSPSSLALFMECPRCFWLYKVKGISRPGGPFPSLPAGMDKILKVHFDSYRGKGKLPPELKELDGHVKLFDNLSLLTQWRSNFKGIRWTDPKSGIVLMGAVDDMLERDGKLITLDFKTRGYPLKDDTHEHYQHQLDIYAFLLEKNGFEVEDYSYLLFYHPDCVEDNGAVRFNIDLIKVKVVVGHAEKLFYDAVKVVQGEEPPKGKECEWCGWG